MKKRTSLLKTGVVLSLATGFLWLVNNLFDWVLYPATLVFLGNTDGAVVMTALSVPFNLLLIKAYNLIGKDLFALEKIKKVEISKSNSLWGKAVRGIKRWGGFFMLSLYDPVPAVLYARDNRKSFKGLAGFDWLYFILATIIANGVWILFIILGIEFFKFPL